MKFLLICILLIGCGGSNPAPDSTPMDTTKIIAPDSSPEAADDLSIPTDLPSTICFSKVLQIGREAEKCFDGITGFWEYMKELEEIDCKDLLEDRYPPACRQNN